MSGSRNRIVPIVLVNTGERYAHGHALACPGYLVSFLPKSLCMIASGRSGYRSECSIEATGGDVMPPPILLSSLLSGRLLGRGKEKHMAGQYGRWSLQGGCYAVLLGVILFSL